MIRFVFTLLFCAFCSIFFMQESFFTYLEQRYHNDFGLREKCENSWLGSGARAYKFVINRFKKKEFVNPNEEICENILNSLTLPKNQPSFEIADLNLEAKSQEVLKYLQEAKKPQKKEKKQDLASQKKKIEENKKKILAMQEKIKKAKALATDDKNATKTANLSDTNSTKTAALNDTNATQDDIKIAKLTPKRIGKQISLNSGDSVIFIGDSVMEYVAQMAKRIFPKSNLQVIDLSKHSTGLNNKKYYDFNAEIKKTIKATQNVKLVVVLLGANDIWPQWNNGKKRDFYSQGWIDAYENSIDEIYRTASQNNARVLWLSLPCMKKQDLHAKTRKLNRIYKDQSTKFAELFMDTSDYICKNSEYISHISVGKKTIKVRQDDGVHITKDGSMIIAKEILRMINVN